jgi:hypothetical protein
MTAALRLGALHRQILHVLGPAYEHEYLVAESRGN